MVVVQLRGHLQKVAERNARNLGVLWLTGTADEKLMAVAWAVQMVLLHNQSSFKFQGLLEGGQHTVQDNLEATAYLQGPSFASVGVAVISSTLRPVRLHCPPTQKQCPPTY